MLVKIKGLLNYAAEMFRLKVTRVRINIWSLGNIAFSDRTRVEILRQARYTAQADHSRSQPRFSELSRTREESKVSDA